MTGTGWLRTVAGCWVRTVEASGRKIFVVIFRKRDSWKWLGYGNGEPLGEFDGFANAKRKAPEVAKHMRRLEAL